MREFLIIFLGKELLSWGLLVFSLVGLADEDMSMSVGWTTEGVWPVSVK